MRITFDKTQEQIELVKAMGSSNRLESMEAQEAFAAELGPVIGEVLLPAGTAGVFYEDLTFNEDDSPSIPVDAYYGEPEGTYAVWQQTVAGGLPTQLMGSFAEIKVSTYDLDSAISFNKRYAKNSSLDVVARGLERLANDVLLKQERNAWYVVLAAAAQAATNSVNHVFRSQTSGRFQVDDINKMFTVMKRINAAYEGSTAVDGGSRGMTDLYVSPEVMEQVRAFAYNPVNTIQATSGTTSIPLTDSVRDRIFSAAGTSEIWGVKLHELLELGEGRKYNVLFDQIAGSKAFAQADGTTGSAVFAATDEILLGIDRTRRAFIRTLAVNAENGGSFILNADDQFVSRSKKFGFYGGVDEGRVLLNSKAVGGLII